MASAYAKAPVGKRILAYIVDGIIGTIPLLVLTPLAIIPFYNQMQDSAWGGGPDTGTIILFILAMLVGGLWAMLYTLLRDGFGKGQSPGKKLCGLMVVRLSDNRPCTKGNSFVRNVFALIIVAFLVWIPVLNALAAWAEPIIALAHSQGFRIGDMVAKTQVIDATEYRG